jgi:antitoxin (DNA-binding transcriptional repressor) of toxin-antitoxin stability system
MVNRNKSEQQVVAEAETRSVLLSSSRSFCSNNNTSYLTTLIDYISNSLMKTIQISKFKATCLKLVKETGESLCLTLRGKPMAAISPVSVSGENETILETLKRLQPLLAEEDQELDLKDLRRNCRDVPKL